MNSANGPRAVTKNLCAPVQGGPREVPEMMIEGVRAYHLWFSRKRAGRPGVKAPRHFLVYRRSGEAIELVRILHDARAPDQTI